MKVYDISQEVFGCEVYPGDPVPEQKVLSKISEGSICNLSEFSMCAHNGTHVDAPYHFYKNGKTISDIDLKRFIGTAYVAEHDGIVTAEDATDIIEKAKEADGKPVRRILLKGKVAVSLDAAEVFAKAGILLLGNEPQTFGTEDTIMDVHLKLLEAEIVLLEGIRLGEVPEGVYFLNAAPLNLGGADGAPCRAVLICM